MKPTILVIDDESSVLKVIEKRLQTYNCKIITGTSGEEALDLTKKHNPNLIIMDVMMPPPNGFQVCRMLKDNPEYKKIPIILLTAKSTESDKFWGTEAGADAYLTKPYNADELLEQITILINNKLFKKS